MRDSWRDIDSGMFDFGDYYTKIAKEIPDNCRVCEVGISHGCSAIFLAEAILNEGKRIDRFIMVDDCSYGKENQIMEIFKNSIRSGIKELEFLPMDSIEASKRFNGQYFDFIFIDASHYYQKTIDEIKAYYWLAKNESILAGHDYYTHSETKRAVDETIPKMTTRTDIPDREFEPEEVLKTYDTSQGFGVWEICKKHYIEL